MGMPMPVDAIDDLLREEVARARDALIDVAYQDRERWWTAYELKRRARNGWSSGVMGLALRELLSEGHFERGPDLRVRLRID